MILPSVEDHTCVWMNVSREQCLTGGSEFAGAGVYLPAPEEAFRDAVWGAAEEYGDARLKLCRAFAPVSSPVCPAC